MERNRKVRRLLLQLCDPRAGATTPTPANGSAYPELSPKRWQELFTLAAAHGVVAILLKNLGEPCAANHDAWQLAERFLRARQVRALRLRRYAAELLAALADTGIPAADFKGSDFADHLYPSSNLRPTSDIDILVPRNRLADTAAVLNRLGYAKAAAPSMRFAECEYGEQTWNHATAADIEVDLHWNLINHPVLRRRASIDLTDLDWTRDDAAVEGRRVATPATRLVIAAAHATFGHQFDRLLLLCDIRESSRQLTDDSAVSSVGSIAERTGMRASVELALATTARWLGDSASAGLLRRLGGRAITRGGSLLVSEKMLLSSGGRGHRVRRRLLRELLKRAA